MECPQRNAESRYGLSALRTRQNPAGSITPRTREHKQKQGGKAKTLVRCLTQNVAALINLLSYSIIETSRCPGMEWSGTVARFGSWNLDDRPLDMRHGLGPTSSGLGSFGVAAGGPTT